MCRSHPDRPSLRDQIDAPTGRRDALAQEGDFERKEESISVMSVIDALISSLRSDDRGQGLAEYALILALIAIVAILALLFLGSQISTILSRVGNSV